MSTPAETIDWIFCVWLWAMDRIISGHSSS